MKQYLKNVKLRTSKKNKHFNLLEKYNYDVIKIKFYKEFYVNDNADAINISSNFLNGLVDLGFNQLDKISQCMTLKKI